MNATKTILDWKNVVWLSLVSYALYTTLWLVIDDEIWHAPGQFSVTEMAVDFCMCVLFVGFSLLYSRTILRILPMRNRPYVRLLLMVCILFLLNNAMAYAMTVLCDAIWGDGSDELFRMQGIYTYGMVATFVSCIYSNAFYLETYMHTENEKRRLEIALLKEQEVALQSQLDALKSQIDTHFMFNNFSILAELIEEDRVLAGKFLANLSKVYRYIIQNMKRHKVPVGEEIAFSGCLPLPDRDAIRQSRRRPHRERCAHRRRQHPARLPATAGRERHQAQPPFGRGTAAYRYPARGEPYIGLQPRCTAFLCGGAFDGHRSEEHRRTLRAAQRPADDRQLYPRYIRCQTTHP